MVKCVNLNGIHRRIVQLSISLLQMLSIPTGPIDLLGNDSQRDRATAGALLVALWTNGCGQSAIMPFVPHCPQQDGPENLDGIEPSFPLAPQ